MYSKWHLPRRGRSMRVARPWDFVAEGEINGVGECVHAVMLRLACLAELQRSHSRETGIHFVKSVGWIFNPQQIDTNPFASAR